MDQELNSLIHSTPLPRREEQGGGSSDFEQALRPLRFDDFAG